MIFADKRVLITGSTRGIGRDTAKAMLVAGARVAINGRTEARVKKTIEELGGGNMVAAPGDVSTAPSCEALVRTAIDGLGGLDILFNNAGIYSLASVEETSESLWDVTMDVNVKGMFFCARASLDALRDGGGVIINHGSNAGLSGFSGVSLYCASKGAVVNLTRAMAVEFAPKVRVNCVCPSTIDNEMGWREFNITNDPAGAYQKYKEHNLMKRMGSNDDVVSSVMFLASDQASFLSGVALPIDGGKSATC